MDATPGKVRRHERAWQPRSGPIEEIPDGAVAVDNRPHIVVVEDEPSQRQLLADYLEKQGFRVSAVDGGPALRRLIERESPALVLLDVGLPGEDGFALARWLRERNARMGIIMVTIASDTIDRVVGLETGADDYVGKPFEPRELLARVKSVLRRTACSSEPASPTHFVFDRFVVDIDRRELRSGAETVAIEPQVFDLLVYLLQNRERVVSKDDLIAKVWGGRIVSESTITSRVYAARKAVGDAGEQQRLIRTIARRGFRFVGTVRAAGPDEIYSVAGTNM